MVAKRVTGINEKPYRLIRSWREDGMRIPPRASGTPINPQMHMAVMGQGRLANERFCSVCSGGLLLCSSIVPKNGLLIFSKSPR